MLAEVQLMVRKKKKIFSTNTESQIYNLKDNFLEIIKNKSWRKLIFTEFEEGLNFE